MKKKMVIKKDKIKEFQDKMEKEVDKKKIAANQQKDLKKFYDECIETLKYFIDMEEKYYPIVALWIIGTYFHKQFPAYPYLYINAVKSSGKTRLLKLIAHLAWNGRMQVDLTDASLFRLAETSTFCIDELENINRKEKNTLRLLLNAAYKKGITVPRMAKKGDSQVLEEFALFCPVAMANIWGLDDVLQDRCITIPLERSTKKTTLKILEVFPIANRIVSVVSVDVVTNITKEYQAYNLFIKETTHTTHTTHTPQTTLTTPIQSKLIDFFIKIRDSSLEGRNLELFFPLLLIAWAIDRSIFELNLTIFEKMAKEKTSEDVYENKDVGLLDYLYQIKNKPNQEFISISEITKNFKEWLHEGEEENKWVNTKWIGRSLKRSNIIESKRRKGEGIEVIVDFKKVRDKLAKFKELPSSPKEEEQETLDETDPEKIEEEIK